MRTQATGRVYGNIYYKQGSAEMNRVSRKILDDAESRVASIEEELEKEVLQAAGAHKRDMERQEESRAAGLDALYSAELNRLRVLHELEIRKNLLAARRRLLDDVLDDVAALLGKDRGTRLKYIVEMAVRGVFSGDEEIIVSAKDRNLVDETLLREINSRSGEKLGRKTSLTLSGDVLNNGDGLMLRSGPVQFNATVRAAVAGAAEEYELDILRMLFGGKSPGRGGQA